MYVYIYIGFTRTNCVLTPFLCVRLAALGGRSPFERASFLILEYVAREDVRNQSQL